MTLVIGCDWRIQTQDEDSIVSPKNWHLPTFVLPLNTWWKWWFRKPSVFWGTSLSGCSSPPINLPQGTQQIRSNYNKPTHVGNFLLYVYIYMIYISHACVTYILYITSHTSLYTYNSYCKTNNNFITFYNHGLYQLTLLDLRCSTKVTKAHITSASPRCIRTAVHAAMPLAFGSGVGSARRERRSDARRERWRAVGSQDLAEDFPWKIHWEVTISLEYVQNMYRICTEYVLNMYRREAQNHFWIDWKRDTESPFLEHGIYLREDHFIG